MEQEAAYNITCKFCFCGTCQHVDSEHRDNVCPFVSSGDVDLCDDYKAMDMTGESFR